MTDRKPYCYLLSTDTVKLTPELFPDTARFRGVTVVESESGCLKLELPGRGSAQLCAVTGDELAPVLEKIRAKLGEYEPDSAATWMSAYLKNVSTAVIMDFHAENYASQQSAEEVRCTVWEACNGLWHYPRESFTNEDGALVLVARTGGIDGERLVATLNDGGWVEYTIDLTNSVRFDRFKRGVLPPGVV